MNRICVYSGSNLGNKPEYKKCALQLGEILAHFFDPFIDMIVKAIQERFMNQSNEKLFLVDTDPNSLLDKMKAYSPPDLGIKWHELQEK